VADPQALELAQLLGQVAVIESDGAGVDPFHDPLSVLATQPAGRRPPAVAVQQTGDSSPPVGDLEPAELPPTEPQGLRGFNVGDLPYKCGLHQAQPPGFLAAHRQMSQGGTSSRGSQGGRILWQEQVLSSR
jgi:hypothetical protein